MTSFIQLSAELRAFTALWVLLLCLYGIICMVQSIRNRKYGYTAVSMCCFLITCFMRQVIIEIYEMYLGREPAHFGITVGNTPCILWLIMLIAVTVCLTALWMWNRRYAAENITPAAIKNCTDEMPCGICYWQPDGRVIFSNKCINDLCIALTGRPLLNGNSFRSAITDRTLKIGSRNWRFVCREIGFEGNQLNEMIASDVTDLYNITEALQKDTERLRQMNLELTEYNHAIDDIVRRQEILQAKIDIHDEMNRLILLSASVRENDPAELDNIFVLWRKNMQILHKNADGEKDHRYEDNRIEELAHALGIMLKWRGAMPDRLTAQQRELFYIAAREAIANAAKHAEAAEMEIGFEEYGSQVRCYMKNNGTVPPEAVRFQGGLKNLAALAQKDGVIVTATSDKYFTLSMIMPLKQ